MPGIGSKACPKPPKGSHRLAQLKVRRERIQAEERVKEIVRRRDGFRCRVPECTYRRAGIALHVAHLEDKGMGGDPNLDRTQRHKLICLCYLHHQGEISVHQKTLRVEPDTELGTDGPCAFWVIDEQKRWQSIGVG